MTAIEDQARSIFLAALEHAPEQWTAFLDETCGDRGELRARVDQLLHAHQALGSIHGGGPKNPDATRDQLVAERPGTIIGPYKLLQQIGEGGMGTVFMAEQTHPVQRKVALKVIKPGMDSRQVIARFEAERQALAMMDHVNIARVLDAGTIGEARDEGRGASEESSPQAPLIPRPSPLASRPYFVMELVHGVPITKYCDDNHLTPRERLELFVPVCQAIQHAHQKGIIHRDIKPSNVMVTLYDGKPVPKVIDFGVAKATEQKLTERTLFTQYGTMVGTLEYMSPEQAEMSALGVDTRSDIYSLGVLLYELLTGSTPLTHKRMKEAAYADILRMIKEEEPPKPSTRLSDSGEALASISALRKTEPAKLTKLMRGELDWIVMRTLEKDRNRRYETANGFAADVQRYLADEPVQACPPSALYRFRKFARRNKSSLAVVALVLFFLVLLGSGVGWAVRDRSAREAEATRQRGERQAKIAGQVESVFAEVDRLEGEQKWPEAMAAARRSAAAVASGEADAETAERVRGRVKDLEFINRLEQIRMDKAMWVNGATWDRARVDREYAQAFRDHDVNVDALAVETSINRLKASPALAIPLAAALDDWVHARRKQDAAGWKRLVAVARGIDPDPLRNRVRSTWGQPVSEVQDELRRLIDSIDVRRQHPATLHLLDSLGGVEKSEAARRLLRNAQEAYPGDFWLNFALGYELGNQRDWEGAIRFYTAAVSLRPNSDAAQINLGNVLRDQGKLDEAIRHYRKAIEFAPDRAMAYSGIGLALLDQKKLDEAIVWFKKAIDADPNWSGSHNNLGNSYVHLKEYGKAIACFRKAIDLEPNEKGYVFNYERAYREFGKDLRKQKKLDEAIDAFRKALEINPKSFDALDHLGQALRDQKKLDEAIDHYRKAIELLPNNPAFHQGLGNVLQDQNKLDQAIACYSRAIELSPKFAGPYNDLGTVLTSQGKLDQAIACHKKAIELDPTWAAPHTNLGNALLGQKKLDEAIDHYRKAVELDANGTGTLSGRYVDLGLALHEQKKLDEAIDAFCKAVEINPKDATAQNGLGALLCNRKDYDKGAECFRKAIELNPKIAQYWVNLSIALVSKGKLDDAIAAYRKAIEIDPNSKVAAVAYFRIGKILEDQGKLDETIACFRKAAELDPNYAIAHSCLAWLLTNCREAKYRDASAGLDAARKAVKGAPRSSLAWQVLGWAHYRGGDWKASIEALEKSCDLDDDPKGGNAFQWFSLAMAYWKLDEKDKACARYEQAVQWMDKNSPGDELLRRFRAEAAELLELKEKK